MRRWMLPALAGLLQAGAVDAAVDAAPRLALQGELLAAAPAAIADGSRLQLSARLLPAARRPDPQPRFLLSAQLEDSRKASCSVPTAIFYDSFEDR